MGPWLLRVTATLVLLLWLAVLVGVARQCT